MKETGVFVPQEKLEEVKKLLQPKISMDFDTNTNTTTYGDKEAAWKLLDEFAAAQGLPPLPDGQHYGVTAERELVAP